MNQEEDYPRTAEAFENLFAVVSDPKTKDSHQQHLALVKHILYLNELGWTLRELSEVNQLLLLVRGKVELHGRTEFLPLLVAATRICTLSFVRYRSNEELSQPSLILMLSSTLGQLLLFDNTDVQGAAIDAIYNLADGTCLGRHDEQSLLARRKTDHDDQRVSPKDFSRSCLEESGAVEMIASLLKALLPMESSETEVNGDTRENVFLKADDAEAEIIVSSVLNEITDQIVHAKKVEMEVKVNALQFPLLELIREVSSHRACGETLVANDALTHIIFVLSSIKSTRDERLPTCLETLWDVLEQCDKTMKSMKTCRSRRQLLEKCRLQNAIFAMNNMFALETLLHTLEMLLMHGHRQQDKELRNMCMIILHLVAKRTSALPTFYSSGVTSCILSYAVAAESAQMDQSQYARKENAAAVTSNVRHYATNAPVDVEFKQLTWYLIARLSEDNAENCAAVASFRIVEVWLHYALDDYATTSNAADKPTSVLQYSVTQSRMLGRSAMQVLIIVARRMLEHFYEIDGHAVIAKAMEDLAGCSEDYIVDAWQLLNSVVLPLDWIQESWYGIRVLVIALRTVSSRNHGNCRLRRHALLICCNLCRGNEHHLAQFYHAGGVSIVLTLLQYNSSQFMLEDCLLFAVLEAVRTCIVGYSESEQRFIQGDGIHKLLSIIEVAPKTVQAHTLAVLSDVCTLPTALPSFTSWRGDHGNTNNQSALKLLLNLYFQEERLYGVENNPSYIQSSNQEDEDVPSTLRRQQAFEAVTQCISTLSLADDTSGDLTSPLSTSRPDSPAFARLHDALRSSQNQLTVSDVGTYLNETNPEKLRSIRALDLRSKIYALLSCTSFPVLTDDVLSAKEETLLEVIKELPTFQEGEKWQEIELTLHAEGVRPIYADALLIRHHIEQAYNAAVCTQHARQEIQSRVHVNHYEQEQAYLDKILLQKKQEAQAEAFHQLNKRQNSTLALHKEAKARRMDVLQKQDPVTFAAMMNAGENGFQLDDPAPEVIEEEFNSLRMKEAEIGGKLSTLDR